MGPSHRLWVIALFLLGASCRSAPSLRVDADVLERITIENKLLLFDAENELNIAVDARDQVVDEIAQLKQDMKRATKKRDVAERDEDVFSEKGDAERSKLAGLRKNAQEARLEYLRSRLSWSRERLTKERKKLIVARSRFELAKARLVKRNNVPGASDIEIEEFEEQVTSYQEDVADADEDIGDAEAEMQEKEVAWTEASATLRAASGGALGSRWLD